MKPIWIALFGGAILILLSATTASADTGDANVQQKVLDLANAIKIAEGSPAHINNPGDLVKSFGYKTSGVFNSEGVLIFASAGDGMAALIQECQLICSGKAAATPNGLDTTIAELAFKYAGPAGADNWATNVARELGVDTSTTIAEWLAQ